MSAEKIIKLWRKQKMGWETKSANKINFGTTGDEKSIKVAKGETIEGRITLIEETQLGRAGGTPPKNYTLELTAKFKTLKVGELVTFLGTSALDRLISSEENQIVRIKYIGDVKSTSTGQDVKQYDVAVYRPDEIEEPVAA